MFFGEITMGEINWAEKILDLGISLIQAGIIACIANYFIKKTDSAIKNSKALSNCGITELNVDNKLYDKEMKKIFKYASSVKVCYITGENLFSQRISQIEYALNRKQRPLEDLKILLCKPETPFMEHIESIEEENGERDENKISLKDAVESVTARFEKINSDKVEIKYNDVFYFFPYMIAEYKTKDGVLKEVYTNFCIPPQQSRTAISMVARVLIKSEGEQYNYDCVNSKWVLDEEGKNLVMDVEKNFEYVWTHSKNPKSANLK